ncbi:PQQ-dependent sugar dehydrogenase [Hufsiella ginkgonis]|uniref:Carbohydrate-binding protein n=1 Tax=Hufsiella ginkgonis TaxID=2695274 RepID=A0A7K1XZB6_9SPHI|nr:PQQ-dependent sugar dehydrogenase [Hufsiella ginkgonis]MXV16355.1 carbohydrate-binding protein [Hufsiella ginkgonis]
MHSNRSIARVAGLSLLVTGGIFYSFVADVPKKPDESRFTAVALTQPGDLDEPNTFEVLKDGRVLISERKGAVKLYDPITKMTSTIAQIPVNMKYTSAKGVVSEAEEGLLGLTVDPNFAVNHWVYTFYSHPTESRFQLTRWVFADERLVPGSEKIVLQFATQRETCCHTGGGMTWDAKGNLYLTVGNNTGTSLSSSTDERPNRVNWDDQRGTANTNSLLGKILRIKPKADGTYLIPAGNLFPPGTKNTRPEIYTMGHRNPWRPSIDSKTGFLYWGDIGSDANEDTEIGPRGYDELNQARKPGFFGWPYFVGPNAAFPIFDYVGGELLDKKDPKKPTNTSVNNTGLKELPPVAPPFIYYPYAASEEFPLVGSGSRSATGGPIYHRADFPLAKRPWPAYYEGKWIATDLARGWIMSIAMKPNGDYLSMERFLPSYRPVEPIDMKFGPSGDLYVLEYGSVWFGASASAKLVRIEYNAGNRKPAIAVSADKSGGTVPLKVALSSAGTKDADGDLLKYRWKVNTPGGVPLLFTTANPAITLTKPGVYTASLTVTDPKGASNTKSLAIIAGNAAPSVNIELNGNATFFFNNKPLGYSVLVNDQEDGSLAAGTISADQVAISMDYASEGFDYAEIIQGQRSVDANTRFAVARALMAKSDCKNCHLDDAKNIGPSFTDIAKKYKGDDKAPAHLVSKVRAGGMGVWQNLISMPAHPSISDADAHTIVKYILSITDKTINTLPVKGTYVTKTPEGDPGNGTFVIRAAYTDHGNKTIPKQTSESTIVLRNPLVSGGAAEIMKGAIVKVNGQDGIVNVIPNTNGYIGYKKLDLTGIKQVELRISTSVREKNPGGKVEIRLDSPDGALIGQAEVPSVEDEPRAINAPPLKADVKDTTGKHDLYFVFKNAAAKASDPLFSLISVKFNDEKK